MENQETSKLCPCEIIPWNFFLQGPGGMGGRGNTLMMVCVRKAEQSWFRAQTQGQTHFFASNSTVRSCHGLVLGSEPPASTRSTRLGNEPEFRAEK